MLEKHRTARGGDEYMKLPEHLAGKLPTGEYTFHITVLNGTVKVLSVLANGKELDIQQSEPDADDESNL